ncbi:unnamed protein product [Eruca vesicaria subsp. sativa]|uniref:Kinesin-like protein n=1 Tax=Eruca vesicaria subsp. sativa TaxID=29727 RepID=A0ABC8KFV1_ERUVS|nr:unnamed protein product [Eruca vesicaria subsp. sativa]
MATEQQDSRLCLASILEDFIKERNIQVSVDVVDSSSKNADETLVGGRDLPADPSDLKRNEAARWLRNTLGVVQGRDLPADPSEDAFRIALRSGILLCNVLNKVKPGAVPKVVEAPNDPLVNQDGAAALSAFQYFENLRNFLVVVEEMGIPTFEVSDFEKGGKSSRIVECVLALKSYREWKQSGGSGTWRYIVTSKPTTFGIAKQYKRKDSESPVDNAVTTSSPSNTPFSEQPLFDSNTKNEGTVSSVDAIVRAVFSDKSKEEVPSIVEDMLNSVMVEYERRLATQNELYKEEDVTKMVNNNMEASQANNAAEETKIQDLDVYVISKEKTEKQQMILDRQQTHTEELKHDIKAVRANLSLLQMKYQQEFTSLGDQNSPIDTICFNSIMIIETFLLVLGEHLRGLAYAATGYQRVLEENRKLYNQVQDLKGSIRVYCRVRPFLPGQTSVLTTVDRIEESTISIATPSKYGKEGHKSFTFNKVFGPSASQEAVFADTQPLIRSVLDGYNVCIFAYGQTGSGKTFTMMGPNELTEESLGVNYRALSDLFHLSSVRKETFSYKISVQMLEIYNEQVRDLLATNGQTSRLEIRNSSADGINVPDATLVPVSTTSDVIHLMNLGQKNRAVSSTAMNDRSSRSHSCLTVHVQGRDLTSGATLRGSMHLVDLAGSERVDKSEVTGDRLKEAQHINKSLSALGDVIASLSQKNNHIPYRNSKLTQLLQDSLGGQAKTLMFIHISPEVDTLGETLSTLKFAERVATVELGAARVNKDTSEVKELKEQIASLKLALARKESETDQTRVITPEKLIRRKSLGVSKSANPRQFQTKHKPSLVDDVNSIEGQSDSASSVDLAGLVGSSPSCKSPSTDEKEEEVKEISEWVDKHEDEITRGNKLQTQLDKRVSSLKREPSISRGNVVVDKGFEVRTIPYEEEANESDETATSDGSEPSNMMWQLNVQVNVPRAAAASNGSSGSSTKLKKTLTKTKSMIPSLIPTPTRRLSLGANGSPGQTSSTRQSSNTVVVKKRQNPK